MPRIRHILFPYDLSEHGDRIVPYIHAMAERFNARITILGVLPPTFAPAPAPLGGYISDDRDASRRALQTRLDVAFVGDLEGFAVERLADGGDPAIRIVEFAKARHVDLIMMPTHGLGVFRTLLVGSVTAKVLHDAECPIWTAAHADAQLAPTVPSTILCAIDEDADTMTLARWACAFAKTWGAQLEFLHVVSPVTDWSSFDRERRLQEDVRDHTRDRLTARLAAAGLHVPLRVAVGGIVTGVVEEARQQRADLIVVGRGSIGEPFGRLRTHAFGIIQRSECPVISV